MRRVRDLGGAKAEVVPVPYWIHGLIGVPCLFTSVLFIGLGWAPGMLAPASSVNHRSISSGIWSVTQSHFYGVPKRSGHQTNIQIPNFKMNNTGFVNNAPKKEHYIIFKMLALSSSFTRKKNAWDEILWNVPDGKHNGEKKKKRPNDMICALMCRSRQRAIVLWDGRKMPMDFLLTVNPKKKIFLNKSTKLSPSFPDIVCSLSGAGGEGRGVGQRILKRSPPCDL